MSAASALSPEQLKHFENILLERRTKLVEELGYIEESNMFKSQKEQGGELSGYGNHLADTASDYNALETNFDLAERGGKYLVYIEEALERIRQGTYGVCKKCGELIPRERLEAVPTATKHVACKEEAKRQEEKEMQAELARIWAAQQKRAQLG